MVLTCSTMKQMKQDSETVDLAARDEGEPLQPYHQLHQHREESEQRLVECRQVHRVCKAATR